jgi:glutamate racemase
MGVTCASAKGAASAAPQAGDAPVGMFDSGAGGFSVLRELRSLLPDEPVLYVADAAHLPYGSRTLDEVRGYAAGIARFLLRRRAKLIVLACNTASAAALHDLRRLFPNVPFVGMEPAVKPAAANTATGVVGVLATPATFQGALYASVVQRFAGGKTVLEQVCPGLVNDVEQGNLDGAETRARLEGALRPLLARGMDTLVLGCTHYPWVIPLIRDIAGPGLRIIDPAPAVARQVRTVLDRSGLRHAPGGATPPVTYVTTGAPAHLRALAVRLLGDTVPMVRTAHWSGARLCAGGAHSGQPASAPTGANATHADSAHSS